ncbi:MAG: ParM/StbA family protein [Oscillospiraceae bacterium]
MIIAIDHGYYAIKTRHFSFPAGITAYSHEPYTKQGVLQYGGKYYVCGTGRQPIQRTKTETENYYLLTLAAIAQEIKYRKASRRSSVHLAAGLPLASYGREKLPFHAYLLRNPQPVRFRWEGESYEIAIEDVKLFPQGYSALALHPELINGEPSVLLMDAGGWTVDLMRLDNGKPNASTCRSLELGMIRCIDETMEQIRRDTGLSVTDAQVERVLNGQSCSVDETVQTIIRSQGRKYTQHILSAAMESGFDLKAMPVIILGGGASVIKRNLRPEDRLCRAICLEGDRVNAEGFERLLAQMSGSVGDT